ncbi:hypothetical protein QBC41DRAFT_313469 [Cercophora samala]|uniref:Zn(2)-C6 fungal-type domain-containing protein n=1 Tax=Cercophora samala TaxID=330535 RepID=A0AA40DDA9_9PEZI|nr:hypothetical protein QBC41DRAFT_313469 [Cercophora samala]
MNGSPGTGNLHEGSFPMHPPMRDFWRSSDAPQEDSFFYTSFPAQDEGINLELNDGVYGYNFHPISTTQHATNAPIDGLAIPVHITSPPLPLSDPEHPILDAGWGGSLHSAHFHGPSVPYSVSFSDPFTLSLGMNDRNTHSSVPHEAHAHNNFLPNLGLQLDIPGTGMTFLPDEDPSLCRPEELLGTFSQRNTNPQRMSPHLIEATLGIPPATSDPQHLIFCHNNGPQSDQGSATLDALSLEQHLPSSPSTLARSPDAPAEPQETASSSTPTRNCRVPSTSRVRLLVAPPGFSHSHILVVTSNPQKWSASLWDSAELAELEKDSKLKALDIKSQIPNHQGGSSHNGNRKRQRVVKTPQSSDTQYVPTASDAQIMSSASVPSPPPALVPTSNDRLPGEALQSRTLKRKADTERQAAAQVKTESACLPCRVMREKCSDSIPCLRCIRVLQSERAIIRVPCQRAALDDIELYRRRTQIGLFVYHYQQRYDSDLPLRSASIVDTNQLEAQLSHNCPLTVADIFEVQEFGTFQRFAPNLLSDHNREKELALQTKVSTLADLKKSKVLAQYMELHMASIIETLGTNNTFIATTLRMAEKYSRPAETKSRTMLRHALYIFTARFLRRTYWVQVDTATEDYRVAWMDAPWRALPVSTPKSLDEAETLNGILKEHLHFLEKCVVDAFTQKIYARKKEDWFEIFLVTFIFQVILSENLEMSFYSSFPGLERPVECPWSTFGGLRSYSSKRIASYFSAINGRDPFMKPGARAWEGFGDTERTYLDQCGIMLKGRWFCHFD